MAIEVGSKLRVECVNGEIYDGELTHICLAMDPEQPTKASIILIDNLCKQKTYGNVHIWCDSIKYIEVIK